MKFSTKEDMEIPIADCFEMLSDFETFERAGLRRGADIARTDDLGRVAVGASWSIKAEIRGKDREFLVELVEFERPNEMRFAAVSGGMTASFLVELVALSRGRTRMRVELEVKPKTLSARLLMQSAKLARNTLNRRYKHRIAHFATDLEDRYKRDMRAGSTLR